MQDDIRNIAEQEQSSCHSPHAAPPEERGGDPGDQDEQRPVETNHEEIDTNLGRFVTLIEPILLVIMGLVIAGLLLSLYMPLFNLSSALR